MHEMGIAMEILDIVRASIPAHIDGARVRRIHLKVGKLAAVVPESLRFCFKVVADKTSADGAELAIAEIDVVVRCDDCHHQWAISEPVFVCPACNSGRTQLVTGRELEISSIEITEEGLSNADL